MVYRRQHNAVAHWHFDEGTGTIAHDVDGGNTGTLGGGDADKTPAWSFGCGLLFDGVDDLVKVPDSDGLDLAGDELTIVAWVNPQRAQIGPLVKKTNRTHGYRISLTDTGALRFALRHNEQDHTVTSTTTLPLHQWTHVTARYDGAQLRILINGTIDTATTAMTGALTATDAPLFIGGERTHFHGYLDDLSIYNRVLSDSEITDLVDCVDKRYEYHHLNALGSNIVLTDDDQNVLARYEYDVFGAIRAETGTSDNTRKFTGKEFDADSNLYYYGARYYDPYIGRFTQRDPAGDGVNWYAYTYNNPLKYTDPNGQEPVLDQVGTVDEFVDDFNKANPGPVKLSKFAPSLRGKEASTPTGVIPESNRYIYTEKYGWIDMRHFLAAAGTASSYMGGPWYDNPILEQVGAYIYATSLGYALELDQSKSDIPGERRSAFSYEDLPSNAAGAAFGAYGYDPNSKVPLGEQIREWLKKEAAPVDNPREAPNYRQLPATQGEHNPDPPKNYTPFPYKFPKANQEDGG